MLSLNFVRVCAFFGRSCKRFSFLDSLFAKTWSLNIAVFEKHFSPINNIMKSDFGVQIRYLLIWRWGVIRARSWLRRRIPLPLLGSSRTNNAHSTRDWTWREKFSSFLTKLWNKKMDSFVAVQIKTAVSNFIVSFYFF